MISEGLDMPATQGTDQGPHPPAPAPATYPPNTLALAILQMVRERQQPCHPTPSSRTQEYIREARSGGMYGYGDDVGQ
jgi:hypothetical protein